MGVKLDRVKSLALGKVKEIHRLEVKALEEKLQVNPRWIRDGEPPMLLPAWPRHVNPPPPLSVSEAFTGYGGPLDMDLMHEVMKVVEAGLERRGVTLEAERRVRLYRGLYEFSLPLGRVNMAAADPILDVVVSSIKEGGKES